MQNGKRRRKNQHNLISAVSHTNDARNVIPPMQKTLKDNQLACTCCVPTEVLHISEWVLGIDEVFIAE